MTNYWGQAEKKMASATCMASSAYLLANSATVFQNQSLTRQMQPQRLQTADLPALQVASLVVQEQFAKDAQIIPDLGETLSASGGAVSASYSPPPDDIRVPFQKKRFVGIPEGLFQYYDNVNVTSHMGIMPEIERVWISIDHKLFLWNYVEGQEINSFLDQADVITHVALTKPKRGMFIDEISWLLVICTPLSILLLGISLSPVTDSTGRSHKEIKLYATDLSVSTEIEMVSVAGTEEGRVFMCGAQDGNLYELHYQEKESFFGKRVQLVNHSVGGVQSLLPRFASSNSDDNISLVVADHERGCFYALTQKNSIAIYKPTTDKNVQHIQTLSNLYKAAQDKAPGSPALSPQSFQIVSLHVISTSESRSGLQLMAVTTNAVRLYFSPAIAYSYSYGSAGNGTRPLQLVHIRLPPTNLLHPDEVSMPRRPIVSRYGGPQPPQPTSRPYLLTSLDNSAYLNGLTVATQSGDTEGSDYVLCIAPDLTRIGALGQLNISHPPAMNQYQAANTRPPLTECGMLLAIPGRTWAMAVVPQAQPFSTPEGTPMPAVLNEFSYQFVEPPNQFMLLTNVGLTFLAKRRPVDYLKAILEDLQTEGNVQAIIEFRDSFGRDQTCAMLLGLASESTYFDDSDTEAGTGNVPHELASVAKQAFYDFGERPVWTERVTYGSTDIQGTAIYSGRREGLAIYLSRLARPIWKTKVTTLKNPSLQALAIGEGVLEYIQKNLHTLKDFLDRNPHLFHSAPGETSHRAAGPEQEAWRAEQQSISDINALLARIVEALSFILLLNDYNLSELIAQCDPVIQKLILNTTFEELITTQHGVTISRALVNVVIDQQIGQQISVDTISEVLQQRCGSFCSTDDVMIYKAKENIRKAVETRDLNERQNWLAESLRLFSKGARILEFEKLREICGDYQQLNYAKGTIVLPLSCAHVFDVNSAGLERWRAGYPQGGPGHEAAEQRLQCYGLVLDSLAVFEEKCSARPVTGTKLIEDPETVRSHAYELAFSSDDEMFHSTLYDWLIDRKLADDLLEMRPGYLEAHLKREPASVQKYQLLWQFYVKNDQPLRAAEVLGVLAASNQFELNLEQRLEYLTLAVANAKSHPVSASGRHETAVTFLTGLEEQLDVAQVQLEIYNTLLPHMDDAPEVADRVRRLSEQLFTMSELYTHYAVPFDLPIIKLSCLHVSEHRDENVVRPIWNTIIQEIVDLPQEEGRPTTADLLSSTLVPLGQRFYPSESAFPLKYIATLLVRFSLARKGGVPAGWVPRLLVQCGVPYSEVWAISHEMYESQVPPFNMQENVQLVSSDISILLSDWLEQAKRPQSPAARDFPAGQIDAAVDQYLSELESSRTETRTRYQDIKRQLRRNW